jgi:type I restriction enzyme S subunit
MVPKDGVVDFRFLYYLLMRHREEIIGQATGGAQQNLSGELIKGFTFDFPTFPEQQAIAKSLWLLDEKMAINQAISKTLEQIAQKIYQSWFIDFDPVKAKMAGEKPFGMDESTAALFPDSIQNTDSGMLPKGWLKSKINDVARVSYGAPFGSKLFNSVSYGVPLIRIRDLKNQLIATWTTEVHAKGFMTKAGDLLIGMDGEFNPTLWLGQDSWVNQRICRIEGKSSANSLFLYFCLIPIMRRIEHGSTGSTVIHLGKTDLDAIEIVNPGEALLARYKELTEPMLLMMANLALENRVLTEIRDSLLPRLISGELQIPKEMLV